MSVGVIESGQYNKCADKGRCLRAFPSALTVSDVVNKWFDCTWASNVSEDIEITEDGIYLIVITGAWTAGSGMGLDQGIYASIVTGNKAVTLLQHNSQNHHDRQCLQCCVKLKAGQKVRFTSRAAQGVGQNFAGYYGLRKWTGNYKEVTA